MKSPSRLVVHALVLLAASFTVSTPLRALDEIEILSLSPAPPATLDGIWWSPGRPIPASTSENSVTVVVRYHADGAARGVNVFPIVSSGAAPRIQQVAPTGPVARCGTITGPSTGECAEAFAYTCDEDSPASASFDRVGASMGVGDRVLAQDETAGRYTFRCAPSPPPTRDANSCLVIGTADEPGESALPFPDHLPICRCLRDEGARELRCGLLHPDFLLVRRVPIPLVPGEKVTEVWELLPLTRLDGPLRATFTGGGLEKPLERKLGAGQPGAVERFSLTLVAPKGASALAGLASFEYDMRDTKNPLARNFAVDRSLAKSMFERR